MPLLRAAGILIAVFAVAFCVRTLAVEWDSLKSAISHADIGWLLFALVLGAAAMSGLALLWWRCLHVFGSAPLKRQALAWYFGGELGKYLPGGIWPVLGRGELATGAGISRTTGYLTTLISYAAMCVAAALVCGVLAPVVALDGQGLSWGWIMLILIPAGLLALHPRVMAPLLELGKKVTKGKVDLVAQPWPTMLKLAAWSIPTWLFVGASAVAVAEALRFDQQPSRVAFAAVVAWIIGFLAIPVPAGAGLREVVFLATSGLDAGPAVAVAAISRLLYIVVDAAGGLAGLAAVRRADSR